jgi:hypothetical protein
MIRSLIYLILFAIITLCSQSFAQTQDTIWRVPALDEFHEVMYPIWHTAYPAKDYDALKNFTEEVNSKAEKIYSAALPGIQHDKQKRWDEGVNNFREAVENYNKLTQSDDNEGLLNAAENLHTKYEMLVRIIRPVMKEIDDFHKTLYIVYHDFLPNKNYEELSKVTDTLIKKAMLITEAKVPKKLESQKEEFSSAAAELLISTQELKKITQEQDKDSIDAAIENMHSKYENLVTICE